MNTIKKVRTPSGHILGFNIKNDACNGKIYVTYANKNKKKGADKYISRVLSFTDECENEKKIKEVIKYALEGLNDITSQQKRVLSKKAYEYLINHKNYSKIK